MILPNLCSTRLWRNLLLEDSSYGALTIGSRRQAGQTHNPQPAGPGGLALPSYTQSGLSLPAPPRPGWERGEVLEGSAGRTRAGLWEYLGIVVGPPKVARSAGAQPTTRLVAGFARSRGVQTPGLPWERRRGRDCAKMEHHGKCSSRRSFSTLTLASIPEMREDAVAVVTNLAPKSSGFWTESVVLFFKKSIDC